MRITKLIAILLLFPGMCSSQINFKKLLKLDKDEYHEIIYITKISNDSEVSIISDTSQNPIIKIDQFVYSIPDNCICGRELGGDKDRRNSGGDKDDRDLGGDQVDRDMGGDKDDRDIGGDKDNRSLGGDQGDRNLGGDINDRNLGGDISDRNLGGNKDNRNLGGDQDDRDLAGDKDDRNLGGDKIGRKLGGDVEIRNADGAVTNINCKLLENCVLEIQYPRDNITVKLIDDFGSRIMENKKIALR